jgi:hypothetical protein
MNIRLHLGFAIAVAATSLASAAEPGYAGTLGNFDAIVASCTQLNPAGESAYKAMRASLVGDMSSAELEALMQTPEYREALESSNKSIAAESKDVALKDCIKLMPSHGARQPKPHKHH